MDVRAYILSVVGAVLFSVVSGMIMPEGQIAVFVRSIISLFLFFVIVSPVLGFFESENTIFSPERQIQIQESFVFNTLEKQMQQKEKQISSKLETEFGTETDVEISYVLENGEVSVKNVNIFLLNPVLDGNQQHIDMNNSIKKTVAQLLEIKEEIVSIYG